MPAAAGILGHALPGRDLMDLLVTEEITEVTDPFFKRFSRRFLRFRQEERVTATPANVLPVPLPETDLLVGMA